MPIGPKLKCDSLYLRPLTDLDVTPQYCGWLNDPLVNKYLETRFEKQTQEKVKDFVLEKNLSINEYLYGIFKGKNQSHIGNIKLGPINSHHRLAAVSLFVGDKSAWGKGFATFAIKTVTRFGFESLGLNKLIASMYVQNRASTRAFVKAGWRHECVMTNHYFFEGKPMDLVFVSVVSNDFMMEPD